LLDGSGLRSSGLLLGLDGSFGLVLVDLIAHAVVVVMVIVVVIVVVVPVLVVLTIVLVVQLGVHDVMVLIAIVVVLIAIVMVFVVFGVHLEVVIVVGNLMDDFLPATVALFMERMLEVVAQTLRQRGLLFIVLRGPKVGISVVHDALVVLPRRGNVHRLVDLRPVDLLRGFSGS